MNNTIDICKELHQDFIDFSVEANCERAFPDVRDGLKPGQRACLWEMFIKGYLSNKPHVKSAKISGGVCASWHPHGTTAVYETFARMSQPWINNIPEVDWHGANGSIVMGSRPAADRYTEARLAKVTEEGMFCGIKKKNVPMKLNFSEDEEMPTILPAIFPRLMVNGSQGIGVSIANVWLTHNLTEVGELIINYIQNNEINYNNIAPDFPTGGIIINKNELPIIYKTGKGKVILRGKTTIEKDKILITELPYQVYVEPYIESLKTLIDKNELNGISDIINKTDKNRMLIEIICDDNPQTVLTKLYIQTDLQKTFNPNQYALIGKTPKLFTLKDYCEEYLKHNLECLRKEYEFDLIKAKAREEIVKGLLKALEDIDNIIALIKQSNDSKDAVLNLIKKYSFSEKQAEAIVNMKLGRLAHLEAIELQKEDKELISLIQNCESVLSNEESQKSLIINKLNEFIKKYGKNRKTEIAQINFTKPKKNEEIIETPEDVVVVITEDNHIKRIPKTSFRTQKRGTKGIKSSDIVKDIIKTNTQDTIMFFSSLGLMYKLSVNKIPAGTNSSKGVFINNLINIDAKENIVAAASLYKDTNAEYVVFVTEQGIIKKTLLEEYVKAKRSNGLIAINLNENDKVKKVTFLKDEEVIVITEEGYCIRFDSTAVGVSGRATKGMKAITFKSFTDSIKDILPIKHKDDYLAVFFENGLCKKTPLNDYIKHSRGGKGSLISKINEDTGKVMGCALISDNDDILIIGDKSSVCIKASDIHPLGKNSIGVIAIKQPNKIQAVSKI